MSAASAGSPSRPSGISVTIRSTIVSEMVRASASVGVAPGSTQLTVTWLGPSFVCEYAG